MATVLEECIAEEQGSVVFFRRQKDSMQRIFTKKYFRWEMLSRRALHSLVAKISLKTKRLKQRCGSD
jgi:hypothetical protein